MLFNEYFEKISDELTDSSYTVVKNKTMTREQP